MIKIVKLFVEQPRKNSGEYIPLVQNNTAINSKPTII